MNTTVRAKVKEAIRERQLTQSELAERLGVERQYVSLMLTGKRGGVPDKWQALLDELGLELTVVLKRSASGLPYTGDPETDEILDDVQLTERLLAHRRKFEGLSENQVRDKLEGMLDSGELIPLEQVIAELASGVPSPDVESV